MRAHTILGDINDPVFAGRHRHTVTIGWGDAAKARQRVIADTGITVEIVLPRSTFLVDGAVIADDGAQIVVVQRPAEPAVTVRFDANAGPEAAHRLLLLGYILGNQHAPIDVSSHHVTAPLFTSPEAAEALLAELGINGAVTDTLLAPHGWARTSAAVHITDAHRHD